MWLYQHPVVKCCQANDMAQVHRNILAERILLLICCFLHITAAPRESLVPEVLMPSPVVAKHEGARAPCSIWRLVGVASGSALHAKAVVHTSEEDLLSFDCLELSASLLSLVWGDELLRYPSQSGRNGYLITTRLFDCPPEWVQRGLLADLFPFQNT